MIMKLIYPLKYLKSKNFHFNLFDLAIEKIILNKDLEIKIKF